MRPCRVWLPRAMTKNASSRHWTPLSASFSAPVHLDFNLVYLCICMSSLPATIVWDFGQQRVTCTMDFRMRASLNLSHGLCLDRLNGIGQPWSTHVCCAISFVWLVNFLPTGRVSFSQLSPVFLVLLLVLTESQCKQNPRTRM